jgi:hypothetical protein
LRGYYLVEAAGIDLKCNLLINICLMCIKSTFVTSFVTLYNSFFLTDR